MSVRPVVIPRGVHPLPQNQDAPVESREVRLERFKLLFIDALSTGLLLDAKMELSEVVAFTANRFTVRIRGHVWGEKMGSVTITYPADWWQAVRERWAPQWWVRRFPVQYRRRVVRADCIYPGFVPSMSPASVQVREDYAGCEE